MDMITNEQLEEYFDIDAIRGTFTKSEYTREEILEFLNSGLITAKKGDITGEIPDAIKDIMFSAVIDREEVEEDKIEELFDEAMDLHYELDDDELTDPKLKEDESIEESTKKDDKKEEKIIKEEERGMSSMGDSKEPVVIVLGKDVKDLREAMEMTEKEAEKDITLRWELEGRNVEINLSELVKEGKSLKDISQLMTMKAKPIDKDDEEKGEETTPEPEETAPEAEESAPAEEARPDEPSKPDAPKAILLDDKMRSRGIEEVIDSETLESKLGDSRVAEAMRLRYKGKFIDLDMDKYRAASDADKDKMLDEACGEIDKEAEKPDSKYMTVRDLVEMSVNYYNTLGGGGFNTFILNGIDVNIAEWQAKLTKDGVAPSVDDLKKAILDYCVVVVDKTHGKSREEAIAAMAEYEKSGEKPAAEKPAAEKPAEEKPAEEKPAEEKPAEEKPAEEKPAEEKPSEEKPTEEPALKGSKISERKAIENYDKAIQEAQNIGARIRAEAESRKFKGHLVERYQYLSNKMFNQMLLLTDEEKTKPVEEQRKIREEKMIAFQTGYRNLVAYEEAMATLKSERGTKEDKKKALEQIRALGTEAIDTAMKLKSDIATITFLDKATGAKPKFEQNIRHLDRYVKYSESLQELDKTSKELSEARRMEAEEKERAEKGELNDVEGYSEKRREARRAYRTALIGRRRLSNPIDWNARHDVEEQMAKSVYRFIAQSPSFNPSKGARQNVPKYDAQMIEQAIITLGRSNEMFKEEDREAIMKMVGEELEPKTRSRDDDGAAEIS